MLINEAAYTESEVEEYNAAQAAQIASVETGMEAGADLANIETANGTGGMDAAQIAEFEQTQRENYEEFAEDFEESDPQEAGYLGVEDEAAADGLEAAADDYFDADEGYTSTSDYTMISDEDTNGS